MDTPHLHTPKLNELVAYLDDDKRHLLLVGPHGVGKSYLLHKALGRTTVTTFTIDDDAQVPGANQDIPMLHSAAGLAYGLSLVSTTAPNTTIIVEDADIVVKDSACARKLMDQGRRCVFVASTTAPASIRAIRDTKNVRVMYLRPFAVTTLIDYLVRQFPQLTPAEARAIVLDCQQDLRRCLLQASMHQTALGEGHLAHKSIFEKADAVLHVKRTVGWSECSTMFSDRGEAERIHAAAWAFGPETAYTLDQVAAEQEMHSLVNTWGYEAPQLRDALVTMHRSLVPGIVPVQPNYKSFSDGRPVGTQTVAQRKKQLYQLLKEAQNRRWGLTSVPKIPAQRDAELWRLVQELGGKENGVYEFTWSMEKPLEGKRKARPVPKAKPKKRPKKETKPSKNQLRLDTMIGY